MFAIITSAADTEAELIALLRKTVDELEHEWRTLGHPPNMIGGDFEFEVFEGRFVPMGRFMRFSPGGNIYREKE